MSTADPFILKTLERILTAECDTPVVEAAPAKWPAALWNALEENGLTHAWAGEAAGGAGASVADGFGIVRTAARFAVPVPLAETLLAAWFLAEAGHTVPKGPVCIAVADSNAHVELDVNDRVSGRLERVTYARNCNHMLVVGQSGSSEFVGLVPLEQARIIEGQNLSGEACDEVELDGVEALVVSRGGDASGDGVVLLAAALRSLQIAGALEHILQRTVDYALERKQFGRSLSKFQAVQHNLAQLAGETAAAVAASGAAASTVERFGLADERTLFAVASAKIRCGQAASEGAAIAHQVHGAMGFAAEYPLHLFTKRLWTWRDDYGSETEWAERLGRAVARTGADDFWATLTAT